MAQVTIYTKDHCGFCAQAKALLRAKGVAYTEIDVTRDADLQAEMIERSGRQTVPQIFVAGEHVGGFDDLVTLDGTGQLDHLLSRESDGPYLPVASHRLAILSSGPAG